jgi:histidinol-phosphatase (PHP family)
MWSNYHTHSTYCDGKASLADSLQKASTLNVSVLGFSSHAPLPFERAWAMSKDKLTQYLAEIEALQAENEDIQLYSGLEVDFIPGKISPHDFSPLLDYTIGSVHFVDYLPDGTPWEIDNTYDVFLQGLHAIFAGDIKAAVTRYFEITRSMIRETPPDIVGHIDKIKMHNKNNQFFDEAEPWYVHQIMETVNALKGSPCIVEVNTRGVYKKKTNDTYPGEAMLRLLKDNQIPVLINSDAHHPDELINNFSDTANKLRQIGFNELTVLHEGQWQPLPFNESGIEF